MRLPRLLAYCAAFFAAGPSPTAAVPAGSCSGPGSAAQPDEWNLGNGTCGTSLPQKREDTFFLRIMPLGASITQGISSSDQSGYRKSLRQQLRYDGWQVNMVGSRKNGSMNDNEHEGWPGYRIDQVHDRAVADVPALLPNVFTINVGTNDAIKGYDVGSAGDRMMALLKYLRLQVPGATFIVSTLLPLKSQPNNAHQINIQYRSLVSRLQGEGWKIVLAEMDDGYITLDEMPDGTHPNDGGYKKMAHRFYFAISDAIEAGYLTAPPYAGFDDSASASTTTYQRALGRVWGFVILVFAILTLNLLPPDILTPKSNFVERYKI